MGAIEQKLQYMRLEFLDHGVEEISQQAVSSGMWSGVAFYD